MFDIFKRNKRIIIILNATLPLLFPYAVKDNDTIKTIIDKDDDDVILFIFAITSYFCCNIFKVTKPDEIGFILSDVLDVYFPGYGRIICENNFSRWHDNRTCIDVMKKHTLEYLAFVGDLIDNGIPDISSLDHNILTELSIRKALSTNYPDI